jgi:hypothetical protein
VWRGCGYQFEDTVYLAFRTNSGSLAIKIGKPDPARLGWESESRTPFCVQAGGPIRPDKKLPGNSYHIG